MMTIKEVLDEVTKAYSKLSKVNNNLDGLLHPDWMDELQAVERILEEIPEEIPEEVKEIQYENETNDD